MCGLQEAKSSQTKKTYPLPIIQNIFDALGGRAYFPILDLRFGYWQLD